MRTNKSIYVLTIVAIMVLLISGGEAQSNSRQHRELKMADQAILASLAVSRAPAGKKLCAEQELACVGPDKAELGLDLIGARATKESRLALVNLLAYRLDGSIAEDYRCYVFKAGPPMKRQLLEANSAKLHMRCLEELQKLTRSRSSSFAGLDESAVCADPDKIKMKRKELLEGLNKGVQCGTEDF
ncbi:MAG: Imm57 family immunity protein [Acidobacteriaceae bacterium]